MCTLGQGTADPPSHRVSANQRLRYIFVSAIANIVVSVFVYATVLVILFADELSYSHRVHAIERLCYMFV